jgi:GDP-4-dehydro-6-deoxy-D-mannose reductase
VHRVLVTGSSGFVGRHLLAAISRPEVAHTHRTARSNTRYDIRNASEILNLVSAANPTAVIHLAAQSFVPRSFEDPRETLETNLLGTLNLLKALEQHRFKGKFLYVSSGDVYGRVAEADLPISEALPPRPRNPYAVSKVAAEALCYQWSQTSEMEIVIVRPFNHIGPFQTEAFAVSAFAKQIAEIKLGYHEPTLETGNLEVTRDFTDVRDVVQAYLLLLDSGMSGETYNVCSGVEVRLSELLSTLCDIAGVRPELVTDPSRIRPNEQRRVLGTSQKLRKQTGWTPQISLRQTLTDLFADWTHRLKH